MTREPAPDFSQHWLSEHGPSEHGRMPELCKAQVSLPLQDQVPGLNPRSEVIHREDAMQKSSRAVAAAVALASLSAFLPFNAVKAQQPATTAAETKRKKEAPKPQPSTQTAPRPTAAPATQM